MVDGSRDLEYEADRILREDRAGVTAISEKRYILLEDQLKMRHEREVYAEGGTVDARLLRGLYHRVYVPRNRPTGRGRYSLSQDPWRQDAYESFLG